MRMREKVRIFADMILRRFLSVVCMALLLAGAEVAACTSLIASGSATANGRPMIWKNRDTGADNNFLYRVERPGEIGYIGLFNGGDSLVTDEAWMGMNDAGFAIINTVAYNLPENGKNWIDREGFVMLQALGSCRSVDDFDRLLRELPKPTGVRTCFGVLDADGNGAYFEADDYNFVRYDLADAPDGVLIRTNYAYSGTPDKGMGYIRHQNVEDILGHAIRSHSLTPASLTDSVSCSFYNSMLGRDVLAGATSMAVDQDFVPRRSSTASIVIEGLLPGEDADSLRMWAKVAYPPCTHVVEVRLHDIPEEATATPENARCRLAEEAALLKNKVFRIRRGSGERYIDLDALRAIIPEQQRLNGYR